MLIMTIVVNKWRLDPSRNALIHVETGEVRRLGEYHYALLITFISHANNVLSRQYLMAEVWKNRVVGNNSLPTAIHALRVALDDNGKQQEIIKTVPKKGYVFSKDFVSEWIPEEGDGASARDTVTVLEAVTESEPSPPLVTPVPGAEPPARSAVSASAPERWRSPAVIWGVSVLLVLCVAAATLWGWQRPVSITRPASGMLLKNESYPAIDRITIMHVVNSSLAESTSPSLQNHLGSRLDDLNDLLETHQTTATLFYHVTPAQFSLSILVSDQCNVTWQVVSSLKNWQGHDRQTGERVYQSVERTLNEMPDCKK